MTAPLSPAAVDALAIILTESAAFATLAPGERATVAPTILRAARDLDRLAGHPMVSPEVTYIDGELTERYHAARDQIEAALR